MSTANVIIFKLQNGIVSSQSNHIFEYDNPATVMNIVDYYRSSMGWPLNSSASVLRKRLVDGKPAYQSVNDEFVISPDDTFEITVHYESLQAETITRADVTPDSDTFSTVENESVAEQQSSSMSSGDETLLQQVFDKHTNDVNDFYESLDKETTFRKVNFYSFFTEDIDRALVYCLTVTKVSSNLSFLYKCREKFKRYLRIIIDANFPNFSCKKQTFVQLYAAITAWLKSTILGSFRSAIVEVVWNSYRTARYRNRKRLVVEEDEVIAQHSTTKKRKIDYSKRVSTHDYEMADVELSTVAREMRENKSPDQLLALFHQSIENRYIWIQYILKHPALEKGAAEAVIERFPRLMDNINYLHEDYVYFMKKEKLPVCDVAGKFRKLIPGILGLALSLKFIASIPETNRELEAGEIFPSIVKHYIGGHAKRCQKERYIIGSNNSINMLEIIRKKDELEITAPMIAYVKHHQVVEFYIVVDQKALKLHGSFADALQSLHELQFVLNLEYDEAIAPLFVFMEYVMGFQSRESNSRFRLKHDIQSFLDSD